MYSGEGAGTGGRPVIVIYYLMNLLVLVMLSLSMIKRPIMCSWNTSSFKLRKVSVLIPCSPIW